MQSVLPELKLKDTLTHTVCCMQKMAIETKESLAYWKYGKKKIALHVPVLVLSY